MTSKPIRDSGDDFQKAELAPGDVLGGKFRVVRVVGRGGMGVVVEATNIQLDQIVALKLLATNTDDPAAVERFNHEARAAARLRSEHVARVYDVGKDTLHGPFIVMEMLDGKTLADVISSSGRVPLHRAVEYVIDACEGLAEAHARGIIHQDVKPANLFLVTGPDGRPSVKLLDFGIATMRTKGREDADPKSSHPSLGTPAYLAPEQLRNTKQITHRADVWALGCVLYELLVGDRPFRAKRFTELVTKILETEPEPFPADLNLPQPLIDAVLRCLDRDPDKRFASSAGLALALLPFARPRAHLAATRAVAHATKSGLDPHLEMPSSMPPAPTSSSSELDFPKSEQLRAPGLPKFSTGPADARSTSSGAAQPERSRRGIMLLLALVVLLGGGILAWRLGGTDTTKVGDAQPAASSRAVASTTSEQPRGDGTTTPSPGSAATTAPSAAAAPPSAAVATSAPQTPRPNVVQRPNRPALSAPAPGPAPAKPTGESEIRFQR